MLAWKRTFYAVWIANLVTTMGLQSFLPFFPSHLEELGLVGRGIIAVWTGAVYGATPLSAALLAPVWGMVGDRLGRKAMVVRSMIAIAIFVGAMAYARTPLQLLLLRLLQGAFSGAIAPSVALVSLGAPRGAQGRVAGQLQTALAAGAVLGPVFGGVAGAIFGLHTVFLVVAALAGVAAVLVLVFAVEHEGVRAPVMPGHGTARLRSAFTELRREIDDLWRIPNVRAALVLAFWIQVAVSATAPQIELLVRDLGSGSADAARRATGALFTVMAAASLVATPLWGRVGDRFGHRRALSWAAVASAAALGLHVLAPGLALLACARAALGAAASASAPCGFGAAASETPVERRGEACGVVFSARALAIAISATAGGWLSTMVGLHGLFLLSAGVLAVIALVERPLSLRAQVR